MIFEAGSLLFLKQRGSKSRPKVYIMVSLFALCARIWIGYVLCLQLGLQNFSCAQNIPSSEFQALNDLYTSTRGESWTWQSNEDVYGVKWDFSSPTNNPCVDQWQGINCTILEPFDTYHIDSLRLSKYNLHGALPASLVQLTQLRTLTLSSNILTSSIPHTFGDFYHLNLLDLSLNELSGSIPASLGNLTELISLYLYDNVLSHKLPATLGKLTRLKDLYIEQNELSGTLPEAIGYITTLVNLDVYTNAFTGTLPDSLQNLVSLTFLGLDTNYFSGTVPAYLSQFTQLLDLDMNNNLFTGTLPPALSQLPSLQFLRVHTNYFTGTIPASLVNLTQLKYLELNENLLTGTIPHTLSQMKHLSLLMLQFNRLSGNLYNLVNTTTQKSLANIQLYNNQLTGTLPDSLFQLKSLNTLVLVSNCFSGTLPASMCNANSLYSIVLDGLSSATSCQYKLLLGLSHAYTLKQAVHGHIPPCLYSLPNLTTLHLSGNSLTGSLPDSLNINAGLIDLILSHNLLTSSIPRVFQDRIWYNFDVSYNRLSGTLKNTFASVYPNLTTTEYARLYQLIVSNVSTPSLGLINNRLSGHVPGNILDIKDISILGNNVFSCNIDGSDLPAHDNNRYNYQCGSTEFEVPFYIWLSLSIAVLGSVVLLWCLRSQLQQYIPVEYAVKKVVRWLEYSKHNAVGKAILTEFYSLIDMLCWLTFMCTIFTVVVLLPVYGVLSQYYGTMTHEYAWIVSAAFVSGRAPFGLEFVLWIMMLCVVLLTFARLIRETQLIALRKQLRTGEMTLHDNTRGDIDGTGDTTNRSTFVYIRNILKQSEQITNNTLSKTYATLSTHYEKIIIYVCYALVNLLIVIGANVMYVYVAIYEDADFLIFAQIILSIFKLAWNNALRERTLKRIAEYVIHSESYVFVEKDFASLQIFISLVNNIAIPCCVVAVVSPRCFYNVFVAAPSVSAHFTYQSCNVDPMSGYCVLSAAHRTTSYSPPFTYNYQCSSSLITYYAPAFASLCIISTFVIPGLQVLALTLHKHTTEGSFWHKLVQNMVPVIMLPISAGEASNIHNPILQSTNKNVLSNALTNNNNAANGTNTAVTTYFAANPTLCALLTDLALLLTYGVVFPPLAVALALAIIVSALFAKLKIGRFITNAIAVHTFKADSFINIIINDCEGVGSAPVLRKSMWMLITASCWFYTLFLFDTLGDAVGFHKAVWVLIVMPLMPLVLYICYSVCARCTPPATLPPPSPGNRDSSLYSAGPPSLYTMPSIYTSTRGTISAINTRKSAATGGAGTASGGVNKNGRKVEESMAIVEEAV